jgi:hypothetical protein
MRGLDPKETLKITDVILAGLIVLAAVVPAAMQLRPGQSDHQLSAAGHLVIVEVYGKRIHTIPFSEISGASALNIQAGDGREARLEILESGAVRIIESTCPDKICVRTGWISRPGQSIVCLPNRVVVRIEGSGIKHGQGQGHDLDAITY